MDSRELALDVLLDIEKNKGYSNIVLNKYMIKHQDINNPNLVRELVYGVLENREYLDYIIRKKSSVRLKKIHDTVLMILRLGTYQICFLDRTPDSAAVNESVKLVKKKGLARTSGFVNGVLRNISRNKEESMLIESKSDRDYLSIRYSHPKWLIDSWLDEYGYSFTRDLCSANNQRPSLNIRVNTNKIDRDSLKSKLENKGLDLEYTSYSSYGLVVKNPINIVSMDEYKEGLFSIQDESSMLVAEIMKPRENSLVLDLCSAPGGKSGHIGELMKNTGIVIARDKYKHKIDLIEKNINRLELENVKCELHDGLKLDKELVNKVDYCLLDAPCSALGTIRRSPEIKWTREEEAIKELVNLQRELLDITSNYLRPGGIFIYSTCTINRDENINQIRDFLDRHRDFRLLAIEEENLEGIKNASEGFLEIYPNLYSMDGFFIAKMQRANNTNV